MKAILGAFAAGLLFGIGLIASQMVNPAKVIAFLDLFGAWDPSLAFVMGGALVTTLIGYRFVLKRERPFIAEKFDLPTKTDLDPRLIGGAGLFGIGWGMAGYCPGPAIAALPFMYMETFVFVGAMVVGMMIYHLVDGLLQQRTQPALIDG